MHVLGLDAGGTKTVCLLADQRGTILVERRGPGANLQVAGELGVEKVLYEVMEATLENTGVTPAAICVGIAGVDREDESQSVRQIMRRIGYHTRVLVVNDALIALAAGVGDEAGIVVVAGTGAIAYGRNAAGKAARAGGRGYMIGDEGSGSWIGREALTAVMRAADARGPATRLIADIVEFFGVADVSDLPRLVYDREEPRAHVTAIGPLVQRACEHGDAVAMSILERAAGELLLSVRSVASRLDMRGDAFTCVLAGGVFKAVPWLAAELPRRLVEIAPRSHTHLLTVEPAVGAVRLALEEARGGVTLPRYV